MNRLDVILPADYGNWLAELKHCIADAQLRAVQLKLQCYTVIELKARDFSPEHLGQLGFYVTAVDRQLKSDSDAPTIGLLLCKNKDKLVAEYALQDIHKPIGIFEYELTKILPDNLKTCLPSIEQIEAELGGAIHGR